jgi:hypothetical protein
MTLVEGIPMDAVDGDPNPPVPDSGGRKFAREIAAGPVEADVALRAGDEFSRGQYYAWVKDPAPAESRSPSRGAS